MKKYIISIIFILFTYSIQAQIWLKNDHSIYMGEENSAYNLGWNVNDFIGSYWKYGNSFLKLDCSQESPCLSGNGDTLVVNAAIYAGAFWEQSDSVAKTNINAVVNGGNILNNIHFVTKNNTIRSKKDIKLTSSINASPYSLNINDMKKYIPESVSSDEKGQQYVNYTALLPLLVSGIQTLQTKIVAHRQELDSLKLHGNVSSVRSDMQSEVINSSAGKVVQLTYVIPSGALSAYLQLCDAAGKQIRLVDVLGTQQINFSDTDFDTDVAYSSLIVDGQYKGTEKLNFK